MSTPSRNKAAGIWALLVLATVLLPEAGRAQDDEEEKRRKDPRDAVQALETGRYFRYKRRPVLLLGGGPHSLLWNPSISYKQLHATVSRAGINANRVTLLGTANPDHQAFARQSDGRFDLSTFNDAFWTRLKSYVVDADNHGIVVMLAILDDSGVGPGKSAWEAHPFHPANNTQGLVLNKERGDIGTAGARGSFFDPDNAELLRWQTALVEKAIQETQDFPNVIYLFGSGGATAGDGWVTNWIDLVARKEREGQAIKEKKKRPLPRCVVVDIPARSTAPAPAAAKPEVDGLELTGLAGIDLFETISALSRRTTKPLVLRMATTDAAPQGNLAEAFRSEIWKIFMAGGNLAGYRLFYSGKGEAEGGVIDAKMLDAIEALRKFAASVPFWQMRPAPEVIRGGHALLEPGKALALYLPDSSSVEVDTSSIKGTLIGRWYDIRSAEAMQGFSAAAGGWLKLDTPRRGDWALSLVRP